MSEILAIHGGQPLRTQSPFRPGRCLARKSNGPCCGRGQRQVGPVGRQRSGKFQRRFAHYHQAEHGIAVVNGTVSLRVALLATGIEAGDEVIVPPYTFLATATAVVEANATPIFADVELETANLAPAAVEAAITPRTRAIIPVHLAGLPAKMEAILAIARRHKLTVIEDAAHAHGAALAGRRVGAIGLWDRFPSNRRRT